MFEFSTVNNVYSRKSKYVDSSTDSVLIKFTQEFRICGVFELFSMKIELEFASNRMSNKCIRAPHIIPRINILLDQMNLCEKIRSKCLNLQRIASIFH